MKHIEKRVSILMLILVIGTILTGCKEGKKANILDSIKRESIFESNDETNVSEAGEDTDDTDTSEDWYEMKDSDETDESNIVEEASEQTESTESEESNSDESSDKEYTRGTVNENTYESEYLNLRFTLPKGYDMIDEETLIKETEFPDGIVYKDNEQKEIDFTQASVVYEMEIESLDAPNMYIMICNLFGQDISLEDYIDIFKENLLQRENQFTVDDESNVKLAGATYRELDCSGVFNEQNVQQKVYFRKLNGQIMMIGITSAEDNDEDKIDTLLAAFSEY